MPPSTNPAGLARASHRRASGSAWVNFLLLLGLALVTYLSVVWLPVLADHFEVKQVTRDFMNQAVKNRDDAALVASLSKRLSQVRILTGKDEDGEVWSAPAIEVAPEDIGWDRDQQSKPPTLHVWFEYEREIVYPFVERTQTRVFSVDFTNDISVPQW